MKKVAGGIMVQVKSPHLFASDFCHVKSGRTS